ncbi:MAG: hypothetical protein KGM42_21580, partial [Hyphomicrobiales bacterium]|nr:hypothetical protein [Hyphomicrobiales bacterium]
YKRNTASATWRFTIAAVQPKPARTKRYSAHEVRFAANCAFIPTNVFADIQRPSNDASDRHFLTRRQATIDMHAMIRGCAVEELILR